MTNNQNPQYNFATNSGTQTVTQTETQSGKQAGSGSSTSTTTTAHATGRAQQYNDLNRKAIVTAFVHNIGDFDIKAQLMIERYWRYMDADVIIHAIEETGWAPRPSKRYLSAILHRYACEGIETYEDVLRDEDKHHLFHESDLRLRQSRWMDDGSVLTDFDCFRSFGCLTEKDVNDNLPIRD